ncbi:MAG: hypothetical protein Q4G09_00430 [Clostridia bacterium]|nr:hypothetical protein [Clostridia bacterium]
MEEEQYQIQMPSDVKTRMELINRNRNKRINNNRHFWRYSNINCLYIFPCFWRIYCSSWYICCNYRRYFCSCNER